MDWEFTASSPTPSVHAQLFVGLNGFSRDSTVSVAFHGCVLQLLNECFFGLSAVTACYNLL